MKIIDGMPVSGQPPAGPKTPDAGQPKGPTFSDILKETVDTARTENTARSASVAPAGPVRPPAVTTAEPGHDNRTIDRIERFIDVIDDYRCKLSDPHCSLKQIQPAVERMTAEKENLQVLLDELPDGDPLKDVLNRAVVTASTEVWKFNRGDYI